MISSKLSLILFALMGFCLDAVQSCIAQDIPGGMSDCVPMIVTRHGKSKADPGGAVTNEYELVPPSEKVPEERSSHADQLHRNRVLPSPIASIYWRAQGAAATGELEYAQMLFQECIQMCENPGKLDLSYREEMNMQLAEVQKRIAANNATKH